MMARLCTLLPIELRGSFGIGHFGDATQDARDPLGYIHCVFIWYTYTVYKMIAFQGVQYVRYNTNIYHRRVNPWMHLFAVSMYALRFASSMPRLRWLWLVRYETCYCSRSEKEDISKTITNPVLPPRECFMNQELRQCWLLTVVLVKRIVR